LAANNAIPIIFGVSIESQGFYKTAKLQIRRLKTAVASNGQTFGKVYKWSIATRGNVWPAVSRYTTHIFLSLFENP